MELQAAAGWIATIGAATLLRSFLRTGRRDRAIFAVVLLALAIGIGRSIEIDLFGLRLVMGQ